MSWQALKDLREQVGLLKPFIPEPLSESELTALAKADACYRRCVASRFEVST
jgi:hypothetical protein